jgi:hypothetical protein
MIAAISAARGRSASRLTTSDTSPISRPLALSLEHHHAHVVVEPDSIPQVLELVAHPLVESV